MSTPTIVKQPSNATVYEPQHAAFGVSVSGTSPFSFQWQSSDDGITWTDIPDATHFLYAILSTTTSMSGEHFRCVVTNGEGSATSNAVTLTVSSASSWTSGTDEQIAALLDAAASGEIDLQEDAGWAVGHVRTISVSDWTDGNDVLHAAESLRIAISQFGDYNNCGCLLQFDFEECLTDSQRMSSENTTLGGYGATEMYADTLPALVNALPNWLKDRLKNFSVPTSKGGNESQTIEMVGNNKLALRSVVEVMGTNELSTAGEGTQVEYYESVSNRIKGVIGQTGGWWERSPSYHLDYWCYYGGMGTAATGPTITIGLSPFGCLGGLSQTTPTITSQPQDQTAVAGNTATFAVAATGGELNYSWEYSSAGESGPSGDWHEIFDSAGIRSGSKTNTLQQVADNNLLAAGYYRCFVYITGYRENGVYSDAAFLTVITVPYVWVPPQNKTVTEGQSATFSVTATGLNLAYQWQVSTDNGTSWSDISGAEQDSCTVPATTAAMSGNKYRCMVSNAAGSTTSDAATLTVKPVITLPVITVQPQDQTVTAGQSATFAVTATGLNLAYQWFTYKNGTWYAISGANASSYTAAGTVDMSGAEYHCMVSNAAGAVISDDATLTVTSASQITTPVITAQPQALTVEAGDVASFLIAAEGGALSYQWQIRRSTEWYDITGADSYAYNFPTQAADNGAHLRCVVSNAAGTAISNAALLTVTSEPQPQPEPLRINRYYLIDGFDILPYISENGIRWSRNDVDGENAGRVLQDALMERDRLAIKIRHDISIRPLYTEQLRPILQAIRPPFVTIQYDDIMDGNVTKVMYSNNVSATLGLVFDEDTDLYNEITFPLIEQ